MFKKTILVLISSLYHISHINALSDAKTRKCRTTALNSIQSLGDSLDKPIEADKQIKDLCPQMQYSCCSYKKIYNLAEGYAQGRKTLENVRSFQKEVSALLQDITKDDIVALMNKDDPKIKQCFTTDEINGAEAAFDKALLKKHKIDNFINDFVDKVANHYSGFACSICNADNIVAFYDTQRQEDDLLSFDIANFQKITEFMILYTKIEDAMYHLSIIAKMGLCKNGEATDILEEFKKVEQEGASVIDLEACLKLDVEGLNSQENVKCILNFRETYSPHSIELFAASRDRYESLLRGLFLIKRTSDKQIKFDDYPDYITFYPINKDTTFDKNNIRLVFGLPHALKLEDSQFGQSLWKDQILPVYVAEENKAIETPKKNGKAVL